MVRKHRRPATLAGAPLTTLVALTLTASGGCRTSYPAASEPVQAPEPLEPPPAEPGLPPPEPPPATPQQTAARALTNEGKRLLKSGRIDDALGRLERAASLNPRNGEGHYWLAEVWLAKGNREQAREHHRLAKRHLGAHPDWTARIAAQEQATQ